MVLFGEEDATHIDYLVTLVIHILQIPGNMIMVLYIHLWVNRAFVFKTKSGSKNIVKIVFFKVYLFLFLMEQNYSQLCNVLSTPITF